METLKEPYLFTSSNLEKIVNITVSLKTRMSMIGLIGPRLTDPNAKISIFTDMFRFSEDKKSVEDILKARTNTLNASQFKRYGNSIDYIIMRWDEGYDDDICHNHEKNIIYDDDDDNTIYMYWLMTGYVHVCMYALMYVYTKNIYYVYHIPQ